MRKYTAIPDDSALPGLTAIREAGLAAIFPSLELQDHIVDLELRRYHPGKRATLEGKAGERHFAVKVTADDLSREVEAHRALTAAGLVDDPRGRIPELLAVDRDLGAFVIGWLDGPAAADLVEKGRGTRAGELGALWVHRASELTVKLGHPLNARQRLHKVREWVERLGVTDTALGTLAVSVAAILQGAAPADGAEQLLQGGLYASHVLDLGACPGVIDWGRVGLGRMEFDAGTFVSSLWQIGVTMESSALDVDRAVSTFLSRTATLLDEKVLAWYRSSFLLRLAAQMTRRYKGDTKRSLGAQALIAEAERLARVSNGTASSGG